MAVKFQTNTPITVSFPFGDFLQVAGQYGEQYMYSVEIEGQRDRLYAVPKLHQALQAAEVGPGAVLTVARVEGEGNRKEWVVQREPESNAVNGNAAEETREDEAPQVVRNGHPPTAQPAFSALALLMRQSLSASCEAWLQLGEELAFTSEDIRSVGITLFLESARKGAIPQVKDVPF